MSTGCVDCACVDCAFLDLARRMMQALLPSLSSHSSSEIVRALTVGGCMVWEAMQASHPRMLILEGHHQEVVDFSSCVDMYCSESRHPVTGRI